MRLERTCEVVPGNYIYWTILCLVEHMDTRIAFIPASALH